MLKFQRMQRLLQGLNKSIGQESLKNHKETGLEIG
jgi:hypothetical protein